MTTAKRYPRTVLCSLAVAVLSLAPMPDVPELGDVPLFDKWVHFVMYGGVALCLWFDHYWRRADRCLSWAVVAWSTLYPVALGGLLELGQAYLTTCRSGDWLDFAADAVGAAIAFPLGCGVVRPLAGKLSKDRKREV